MGNGSFNLRNRVLANTRPVNVLLVGTSNAGKSALINTIFRVVSGTSDILLADTNTFSHIDGTTFALHKYEIRECCMNFFDLAGSPYYLEIQQQVLGMVLKGVQTPCVLGNQRVTDACPAEIKRAMLDRLHQIALPEPANKIDCCIIVANAVDMQKAAKQNWVGAEEAILGPYRHYDALVQQLKLMSVATFPYVVFTKMDRTWLREHQLKEAFREFTVDSNMFALTNYTNRNESRIVSTDVTVLTLLKEIIERFDRAK